MGVSPDPLETHRRFKAQLTLPYPLASDVDKRVSLLYQVRRRFPPTTKRVTYLIDKAGAIRGIFHHEINISRHVSDVLEGLKALRQEEPNKTSVD